VSAIHLSLSEACAALAKKEVSSLELLDLTLQRVEEINPRLNAVLRTDPETARTQAVALDAERASGQVRGPLHGIPMAHKDMFYRAGVTSSCGARVVTPVPTVTSTALSRLDEAGAVQFGVLNMAEFAFGPTGHNWSVGHCRNPWSTERVTGGSSSGSAASVAARLAFAALGSDTGASIRVPAAFCGVTGLKTSHGRVSRAGAMGLSFSLDTVGPLARSALDCALVMNAIAGPDGADPSTWQTEKVDFVAGITQSVKGLRVGVPTSYFPEGVDAEIDAALQQSLAALRDLGCVMVPVELPDMVAIDAAGTLITACEVAALHATMIAEQGELYARQVRLRIERGFAVSGVHYVNALRYRGVAMKQFVDQVFSRADVLHVPVVSMQTPEIAATDIESGPEMDRLIGTLTRLARPFNYLGLPSLALPAGRTRDGMPIGMQLAGRPYGEALLLRLGHAFQCITDWHKGAPPLDKPDARQSA
jgi:aspartyl-tRNA(Asn)/glutamyl-tRNA(Gln) amidotransferase subunit A